MLKKFFFTLFLVTVSLSAADILNLVGLLDRNDTAEFRSHVQTISDANLAREDNNKTVLMYAVWVGNEDAVKYLIEKGANVNAQDIGGATALHLAAWKSYTSIALYLIDKGASTTATSNEGMTPMDIAIMRENREIMEAIDKATPKLKKLL